MLAGAIVMTVAYNRDRSAFDNVFGIADYSTDFIETFDSPQNWITCQTVDKEIRVRNNTDVDIVARVKLEEEWTAKDGIGLPLVSNGSGEKMALINLTDDSGWTLDGTYYYSPTLAPGATSTSVISGVTLNCDADLNIDKSYADANYKLSAKVQTIQADKAATEWHKYATVSVKSISDGIKRLRQDSAAADWHIERSATKPTVALDDDNLIQLDNASNTPVYLWLSDATRTVYWYSDADDIYLINNDGERGEYKRFTDNFIYFLSYGGFRDMNTSRITSMNWLFGYGKATSLDGLEKWDVSNVTDMGDLFYNGGNGYITDISALSRWDVSNVTSMGYMFCGHKVADVTPLTGWNVRNVDDYRNMFAHNRVDGSICTLAGWPMKSNPANGGNGMFSSYPDKPPVDARCLGPWNIVYSKSYDWFPSNKYIVPSWAN